MSQVYDIGVMVVNSLCVSSVKHSTMVVASVCVSSV